MSYENYPPELQNKILDAVKKHLDSLKTVVEKRLALLEKRLEGVSRSSTAYIIEGVNAFSRLTESRLLNVAYLRKASLRDPSLDERGCQLMDTVELKDIRDNLARNLQTLWDTIYPADMTPDSLPTMACNQGKCDVNMLLNSSKSSPGVIIICCPRHQFIVENDYNFEIIATFLLAINEQRFAMNLVKRRVF